MADSSKSNETKRWLNAIESKARQRDVAVAMAARAALRVLPLLEVELRQQNRDRDETLALIVLPVWRAAALPWFAAKYPTRRGLSDIAYSVNAAASGAAVNAASRAAKAAAFAAVYAAHAVTYAYAYSYETYSSDVTYSSADTFVASATDNAAEAVGAANEAAHAADENADSVDDDVAAIVSGSSAAEVAGAPLWPNGSPRWASKAWRDFKSALLVANQDWRVWTDWYEARLVGDAARPLNEALEVARTTIGGEVWRHGPTAVNAEIKRLIDLHMPNLLPPTPSTEPGPILEVGKRGLALATPRPLGDFDHLQQSALHERLRRLCPSLVEATRRVGNTHPGLKAIVEEYADLIARPMDAIDAASLWAVGVGILANRDAFASLPRADVMTEPLEPDHLALLEQVAAVHGAFILGFAQGRELTERADQARLTPEILAAIMPPSRDLLARWRDAGQIVEERTRTFFGAVRAAAIEPSWDTARVGYSAYAVTRNALIGVGKLLLIANSIGGTLVVGAALTGVDPNFVEQTRLWIQFVLDHAQTILSFSEPFPELKTWLAAIIDELARDRAFREK